MYLTNIGQAPLDPMGPKEGATEGSPVQSLVTFHADDHVHSGIWECTPGAYPVVKEGSSEFMTFLAGEGTVHGDDGVSYEVGEGVALFLPDGWSGRWEIRETLRKSFTIVKTP